MITRGNVYFSKDLALFSLNKLEGYFDKDSFRTIHKNYYYEDETKIINKGAPTMSYK